MNSGPVRSVGVNVALLCVSVALGLGAVELGARAVGIRPLHVNPEQRHFWRHDPELGWHHRPNQEGSFQTEQFRVHVSINSRGLRDRDYPYEKPPGVRRVVAIGDSFLWGFGVEQDEILTERLERSLPALQVINGGVSGYSTDQALLWLRREGLRYSPAVVVYVLSGNDDVMNHTNRVYWIYDKPRFRLRENGAPALEGVPVPWPSRAARARHWLRSHSAVVYRVETSSLLRATLPWLATQPHGPVDPDPADPHRLTVALVGAMRDAAHSVGAQLVLVSNSTYWFSPRGSYARLVAELRAAGHLVLDVESLPRWDCASMVVQGDGHWNARGHAFVAERLAEVIAPLLL